MSDEELKPCPFCGQPAIGMDEFRSAYCEICGAVGPLEEDGTLRLWNTRPVEDDLRQRAEAAEKRAAEYRAALEWIIAHDNPSFARLTYEIKAKAREALGNIRE